MGERSRRRRRCCAGPSSYVPKPSKSSASTRCACSRSRSRGAAERQAGKRSCWLTQTSAEDVFARVPHMAQRIHPVLKELDRLLDDDELYQQARTDFGKRHRFTLVHGRHSTPVEVLLRMLILKHLSQWSYQQTQDRVDENLALRWFCRLYWAPVPDESTLIPWANTLRPETLHALNARVVKLARQAKVTRGRKLRLDATCLQTEIHHPTDSGL